MEEGSLNESKPHWSTSTNWTRLFKDDKTNFLTWSLSLFVSNNTNLTGIMKTQLTRQLNQMYDFVFNYLRVSLYLDTNPWSAFIKANPTKQHNGGEGVGTIKEIKTCLKNGKDSPHLRFYCIKSVRKERNRKKERKKTKFNQ